MSEQTGEISVELWNEFSVRLKKFISRRVADRSDAEDLTQEVLLKIHAHLEHLHEPEKLYAWIFQIARNTINDFYRRRDRRLEISGTPPDTAIEDLTDEKAEAEVLSWLAPMIADLPDKYHRAVELADVEGMTQANVAERLGISVSGAKSRVQRGREKLRETLVRCCHIEFDRAGKITEWKSKNEDCRYCDPKK